MTESLPSVLRHYTDSTGLYGIVHSRTLWATDYAFLNDALEIVFAEELPGRLLRTAIEKYRYAPEGSIERAVALAADSVHSSLVSQKVRLYILSLSEHDDQLSQWRAYGGPSGGYCLCFSTEKLLEMDVDSPRSPRLKRVLYGETEEVRALFQQAVNHVVEDVLSNAENADVSGRDREYARELVQTLARVKHAAFEEEAEWRLTFSFDDADLKFRQTVLGITPYIEAIFPPSALLSVRIGPAPNQEHREVALRQLLDTSGLKHVSVEKSPTPLRVLG